MKRRTILKSGAAAALTSTAGCSGDGGTGTSSGSGGSGSGGGGGSDSGGTSASGSDYPQNPITVLEPYGPGPTTGISTRLIQKRISEQDLLPVDLQPKVKTGGGGVIAYNTIYGAEPDGYTLCEAQAAAMMLKPLIMEEPNYDPAEYTYLPNSVQYYACAVVPTESDIETGQDLVEAVKGGAKFSATSETSVITVKMLTLGAIGGLFDPEKIMDNLVTYGKSETWPAVTKGEVQFSGGGFSSIIPFLKDDTFKVPLFFHRRDELPDIATELAPDATTLDELDISSSDIDKMQSMYPLDSIFPHLAPPELPSSKTKRLREAWTKAIDSEEYRTMAKDREIRFPIYKSGEEVGNTIANGIGLWREREDLVSMMQG